MRSADFISIARRDHPPERAVIRPCPLFLVIPGDHAAHWRSAARPSRYPNGDDRDLFQFVGIAMESPEEVLFGLVVVRRKRANRSHRFAEVLGLRCEL